MKYDIGFVPQADLMRDTDTMYRTIADAASLRLMIAMWAVVFAGASVISLEFIDKDKR